MKLFAIILISCLNAAAGYIAEAGSSADSRTRGISAATPEDTTAPSPDASLDSLSDSQRASRNPCGCSLNYNPVCGSDGVTYINECILRCQSRYNVLHGRRRIRLRHRGECLFVGCFCLPFYRPVCGTDGNTYRSECYLKCENKRRSRLGLPPIAVRSKGPCPSSSCDCPDTVRPVCGNNDRSYRNICYLQCASRINVQNGRPPIFVRKQGACRYEDCSCPNNYFPVCASDRKTYNNRCKLDCENSRRFALGQNALTIRHWGRCIFKL